MDKLNRFLYAASVTCLLLITGLILVAIWAKVEEVLLWKTIGSASVLLLACGIMLAINFQILKIQAEIRGKNESKTEQGR